ncbi:hypothetical protein DFR52_101867 [Hoeflea marina]|uniref:Uncharacterized protein n=1 Tax=Hoeflea marina TaxID=274592 RepID=A0A317PV82_9HYPH|nr:hypothetical protein [Hoeflea marina]PWW04176.1 hypothetical protein DFR52_101867 [Hoeflea marina]
MSIRSMPAILALTLFALAPAPALAQSDRCLEIASSICQGEDLGPCFDAEESWQMLPEECAGDVQRQIEMDREFYEQQSGNPADDNDEIIGAYSAVIGEDDLYNSSGKRLTAPWQVLRQDRANFHRYGISQPGDEDDPFFGSADNRAAMESLLQNGDIDQSTARALMSGRARVYVEIYGRNGRGTYVTVEVLR